jgi:hypothetical protein
MFRQKTQCLPTRLHSRKKKRRIEAKVGKGRAAYFARGDIVRTIAR